MSFQRAKEHYERLSDSIEQAQKQYVVPLQKQQHALFASLSRRYRFSEKWVFVFDAYFYVSGNGFTIERSDGQYYSSVWSLLTSQEIHLVADILSVVEAYKEGEIDELPDSGEWPEVAMEHYERLHRPQAKASLPKAWSVTG